MGLKHDDFAPTSLIWHDTSDIVIVKARLGTLYSTIITTSIFYLNIFECITCQVNAHFLRIYPNWITGRVLHLSLVIMVWFEQVLWQHGAGYTPDNDVSDQQ